MKHILFFIVITTLSFSTKAQRKESIDHTKNIEVIKSFVQDLSNNNKAIDVILSQHLIVSNPSDDLYDYLEVSLQEIRINLMTKTTNEIVYVPFDKMPHKDTRDIDPEGLDTNSMYFLNYKNRQMLAVYIEKDKIGSFTLVSKGNNQAHFVRY